MTRGRYTKDELIVIATTHLSLEIRKEACEAIYQCGRVDAALEMRDTFAKPAADLAKPEAE